MAIHGLRKRLVFAGVACMLLLAPVAGIAGEDAAKAAFAEAVEIVEQARQTDSLDERWTFYETAREYMSQIRRMLWGTDLARRLWDEWTTEGALYAETTRAVLETGKAACEQDFTAACVLRFARDSVRIVDGASSDQYLVEIARAQAAAGDTAGAFATIEPVHSFTYRETLPTILTAMVMVGDLAGALAKARAYPRRQDRDHALLSVVRASAAERDMVNGRLIAAEIEGTADRSIALATVASADPTSKGGREILYAESLSLAERLVEAKERTSVLLYIAALQYGAGDIDLAGETVEVALTAARAMPNVSTHDYMITIGLERFRKAGADRVFVDQLRGEISAIDDGRSPIEDFLDAAKSKFEAGDVPGAIEILDQARNMALASESEDDRGYFLVRIIADRSEMGDIGGALADWALIQGSNREWAGCKIAVAQAKVGDIEGIRKLLTAGGNDTSNEPELGYEIIPALAQNGYFTHAHELAATMDNDYFLHGEAMIEIAKGEAAEGSFDAAMATAGSIVYRDARARALSEIAAAHFSMGRLNEANRHLMMAFQEMFGPDGILPVKTSAYVGSLHDLNVYDWKGFMKIGKVLAEIETGG